MGIGGTYLVDWEDDWNHIQRRYCLDRGSYGEMKIIRYTIDVFTIENYMGGGKSCNTPGKNDFRIKVRINVPPDDLRLIRIFVDVKRGMFKITGGRG